jgi:hypothetical protein
MESLRGCDSQNKDGWAPLHQALYTSGSSQPVCLCNSSTPGRVDSRYDYNCFSDEILQNVKSCDTIDKGNVTRVGGPLSLLVSHQVRYPRIDVSC